MPGQGIVLAAEAASLAAGTTPELPFPEFTRFPEAFIAATAWSRAG